MIIKLTNLFGTRFKIWFFADI